jgi:hypothetical protein
MEAGKRQNPPMHSLLKIIPLFLAAFMLAAPLVRPAEASTQYDWRVAGRSVPVYSYSYSYGCGVPIKYYDAKTVPGWPAPRIQRRFCGGSYPPAIPFR